jgi:hypothetical protein
MSDQWDDELPVAVTSFDDATRGMLEEQEQKDLEAMGGYDDIVPGVSHLFLVFCFIMMMMMMDRIRVALLELGWLQLPC